jgi:transcriptional regulator with XRE-family HTH domain
LKKLIISIGNLLPQWNVSEKDNDEIFDKIIGLQIRKIRLMRKISQMRLANILNVSFQQVQKYEKGKNLVSYKNLLKIAEYLDISIDYFSKPLDDLNLTFNKKRGINVYPVQSNTRWQDKRMKAISEHYE